MDKPLDSALMWFRRDLRVEDNAVLWHALRDARRVWCVFVLDTEILEPLLQRGLYADRRVEFIVASLHDLNRQIARLAVSAGVEARAGLIVRHGRARHELPHLAHQLGVQAVYASHDDDPAAIERDAMVRGALADRGIALHTSKDHVVFERKEVLTTSGNAYTVFTPYKKAWLRKLEPEVVEPRAVEAFANALAPWPQDMAEGIPSLEAIGFVPTNLHELKLPVGSAGAHELLGDFLQRIDHYGGARDFPAIKGPSYLSVHLRFGTISIRRLVREAWTRMQAGSQGAATWLTELIWREFYHQLLHHHPQVVGHAFRPEFEKIHWEHGKHADALFTAWCAGRTGYPLVDAAMAQINQTGYMHNRLRMVTASFLVKDLGIDWRRGEAYFADHLIDYELAANNGGWQWAASTGCDAQPWFRIFNPVTQSQKFDPEGKFIRRYLPELGKLSNKAIHAPWQAPPLELDGAAVHLGETYPHPIVDHDEARKKTLARYGAVNPKAQKA